MTLAVSIAQSGANNVTMRNRVINGAMMIDQRNAGAVVSLPGAGYTYTVDRFKCYSSASSKWQAQRVSDAPAGFSFSLKVTSLSANSPASGDEYGIFHSIEGLNVPDFAYGTASAVSITMSFWVKASIAGTYPFTTYYDNGSGYQWYTTTYSISSTNTWTYVTLTVPGNTSQALLATNTFGFNCVWALGNGSGTNTSSTNSWQSGAPKFQTSSCVNLLGTNGATLNITGVQLEEGTTATAFEQRLYGTEFALCCRYWQQFPNAVSSSSGASAVPMWCSSATNASTRIYLPTVMRTNPSVSYAGTLATSGATGTIGVYYAGAFRTWSSFSVNETTAESFRADAASSSSFSAGGAAGLYFYTSTQTDVRVMLSAEL